MFLCDWEKIIIFSRHPQANFRLTKGSIRSMGGFSVQFPCAIQIANLPLCIAHDAKWLSLCRDVLLRSNHSNCFILRRAWRISMHSLVIGSIRAFWIQRRNDVEWQRYTSNNLRRVVVIPSSYAVITMTAAHCVFPCSITTIFNILSIFISSNSSTFRSPLSKALCK